MRVVKCVNGHFFDEEKYQLCPHCGGANLAEVLKNGDVNVDKKKKKHKFFGGRKKQENPIEIQILSASDRSFDISLEPIPQMTSEDDDRTVLIVEPVTPSPNVMEIPPAYNVESIQLHPNISIQQGTNIEQQQNNKQTDDDSMQTVAFYDSVTVPVTGWLVCIKGESFGESFEIKVGRNNIGRGNNMDIALLKEMSISRDKHAVIVFDPINLKFFIQAGENGLTYVNQELVMGVKELKDNDKIMIGTSLFVFVPFCGESFDWKDYSK